MKLFKKSHAVSGLFILAIGLVLGLNLETALSSDNDTYEQLQKLENAFIIIQRQYVDEADPKEIVESAVLGMLEELDPHSIYISSEEIDELQETYKGSFGGIGVLFEVIDDTIRVVSTITNGPSDKVGLVAGDRIIAINDSSAIGFTSRDVQKNLKGKIGTKVDVTIHRNRAPRPLDFTITRDRIPLYTIDASYMLDDMTGYVRIDRFAMTTYQEFKEHADKLRQDGMERLIIDLRYNGGGIMESAEKIADELIPGNKTLVYTKGRNAQYDKVVRSTNGGTLENYPVIVLVNEYSASASEIVAGALQDHDRALIVGRRTFGKGLVQSQFQLPDRSVLQMTISRYYTPSGRLIQTPYEDGNIEDYYSQKPQTQHRSLSADEYAENMPDSLKYFTSKNRVVYGGGGILPDYILPLDTLTSPAAGAVIGGQLDQLFAREWFETHEQMYRDTWGTRRAEFIDTYRIGEDVWDAFWEFARDKGVEVTDDPARVNPDADIYAMTDVASQRNTFETRIKALLARQLYGRGVWHPIVNTIDPEINEAIELWGLVEDLAVLHR
ncbi:MAG: S41 family peptidase [Bacteroidota bacterium]